MAITRTIFYPGWHIWELAHFNNSPSSQAYLIPQFLLDGDMGTYWQPSSISGNNDFDIDTDKTDFDTDDFGFGIFIYDYTTDHSNSGAATLTFYHSDNGSSFTQVGSMAITSAAEPVKFIQTVKLQLKRYLRFRLSGLNTYIKVSSLLCGQKVEIGYGPQKPIDTRITYHNDRAFNYIGGGPVHARHRSGFGQYTRRYIVPTEAMYDKLVSLYALSAGGRTPMVMVDYDGTTVLATRLVTLNNVFNPVTISSNLWDVTLVLTEVPYHTGGQSY